MNNTTTIRDLSFSLNQDDYADFRRYCIHTDQSRFVRDAVIEKIHNLNSNNTTNLLKLFSKLDEQNQQKVLDFILNLKIN